MSDDEPNLFLRKLRNRIGYGCGWTFKDAFISKFGPWIGWLISMGILLWIVSHIKIIWVP